MSLDGVIAAEATVVLKEATTVSSGAPVTAVGEFVLGSLRRWFRLCCISGCHSGWFALCMYKFCAYLVESVLPLCEDM